MNICDLIILFTRYTNTFLIERIHFGSIDIECTLEPFSSVRSIIDKRSNIYLENIYSKITKTLEPSHPFEYRSKPDTLKILERIVTDRVSVSPRSQMQRFGDLDALVKFVVPVLPKSSRLSAKEGEVPRPGQRNK